LPEPRPIKQWAEYVYELATALADLFQEEQSSAALNRAISTFEKSIDLANKAQDPEQYMNFNGLGNALE
jgi:hypothetical protein